MAFVSAALDINCQLCLKCMVHTNGAFKTWMKLIKLYEMGIYLVAKIPDIIDERPPN